MSLVVIVIALVLLGLAAWGMYILLAYNLSERGIGARAGAALEV